MNHSFSFKADSRPAGYEIYRCLWKQKLHERIHKILLLDHMVCQVNPVHMLTP